MLLSRVLLFKILSRQVAAMPVPEIFPPKSDGLSLTELAEKAFGRILELGLLQGIGISLLILGSLFLLLVGSLRVLSLYLTYHDTKFWNPYEDIDASEDDLHVSTLRRTHVLAERPVSTWQNHLQRRGSRYIASNPSTPVTKINLRVSPRRAAVIASPCSPSISIPLAQVNSSSPPLRSALSKSPISSKRCSDTGIFFFGLEKDDSSPGSMSSPKCVRWADDLYFSVRSTIETCVQKNKTENLPMSTEAEVDIATSVVGNRNRHQSYTPAIFSLSRQ